MMSESSIFVFRKEITAAEYNICLFKDFSRDESEYVNDEIFAEINEIRTKIHRPNKIIIITKDHSILNKNKIKSRVVKNQEIEYLNYCDKQKLNEEGLLSSGIAEIVKRNKVVQYAPYGTTFKKTSGRTEKYFIKASLSLLNYSEICFMALATYHKITPTTLKSTNKIFVDTSSIISLAQNLIYCYEVINNLKINPQIINFQSYTSSDIDFNRDGCYTLMSASTSGGLKEKNNISSTKCLTLFTPDSLMEEKSLFSIPINQNQNLFHRAIPLTNEDFSLEMAEARGIIIRQAEIERLDSGKLIQKLLHDGFRKIKYNFKYNELKDQECIHFCVDCLKCILESTKFIENTFSRSLSLEKKNIIIFDEYNPKEEIERLVAIKLNDFINNGNRNNICQKQNVIVFIPQALDSTLIRISQKLRQFDLINITYIIGVLVSSDFKQAKDVENNITFNNTDYKYNFFCYLNLPILALEKLDDKIYSSYPLTNGFVFDNKHESSNLNPRIVYVVVYIIIQLLRKGNKLTDNIAYYDVLSPANFSRFNDSFLQLSLLYSAQGRELNYATNKNLSREMKNIILDLLKAKKEVGKEFVEALREDRIQLTDEDKNDVRNTIENSDLFKISEI